MSERITPRKTVADFAEAMEKVLRENDHKGGWEDASEFYFFGRLTEELAELQWALFEGNFESMKKEAVDVANFAMMIFDKAKEVLGGGDK